MKKRFTEEQIGGAEGSRGRSCNEGACRRNRISEPAFYNWNAKYAGMTVSEARRLEERCCLVAGSPSEIIF